MNQSFKLEDYKFFIDIAVEEGPTSMDPVYITTVFVKDANTDKEVLRETYQFIDEEEVEKFIAAVRREGLKMLK